MLFDPKIKYNGKLKRVQFFDPSKVTLKDFDTIKNSFKPGDSLLVNENDSITEAIVKIHESLHPSIKNDSIIRIDIDAMRNLYPGKVSQNTYDYKVNIVVEDGMKIIFTQPLGRIRDNEIPGVKESSTSVGLFTLTYHSTLEEDSEQWKSVIMDSKMLSNGSRFVVINDWMPVIFGDYDVSEFKHNYLIFESYKSNTNYVEIYKTNLKEIQIYPNIGRTMY